MKNRTVKLYVSPLAVLLLVAVLLAVVLLPEPVSEVQERFLEKAALLMSEVTTGDFVESLGDSPAGTAGHAVFFTVCDGVERASVYSATGGTLTAAWESAVRRTSKALASAPAAPLWVKAEVVVNSWPTSAEELSEDLSSALECFDFNGLALDRHFKTALTEGQLNGMGIYDYDEAKISLEELGLCLGRDVLSLPEDLVSFECRGWLCDGDDTVYPLLGGNADNGRREVDPLTDDYVLHMIDTSSAFLVRQVQEDGSFVYGLRPQHDRPLTSYNILRHSGTVWSLILRYRLFPDESLKETIDRTIDYMLGMVRYDKDGAAFLYEEKTDEFKLGGNGIAVVALTEYMEVFDTDKYRDVSAALGEGILKLMDPETGSYWHVLNGDFSRQSEFRTVYYDGEATFALTRLYGLTRDSRWLDAATRAVEHFIAEDYTQYRDHWVAYSLNEITKYVDDRQDFYEFALLNAAKNYGRIMDRQRTYPTNLELLIASFETWQRMVERGVDTGDFDVATLTEVIYARAQRQLSGYFFPEFAMYMEAPDSVLGSFMMRNSSFRVRIDDVQHNIGGYYLYWKNYDALVEAGLPVG